MTASALARRIRAELRVISFRGGDLTTEHGRGRERDRRAILGSGAGLLARASAALTSVLTVPLLLHHLGLSAYGLWATIMAGAAWIGLIHLGIAPSLLNRLITTEGLQRQRVLSTAIWLAVAVAGLAIAAFVPLYVFAPWPAVFNVSDSGLAATARDSLAIVWAGVAVAVPAGIPSVVLRARQQVFLANSVDILASLTRLAVIVLLVLAGASMVEIAFGVTTAVGLVALVGSLAALREGSSWRARWFDRREAASMLTTGIGFTGISVAAVVIMYTDVFVVTQLAGPGAVPGYALPFSLLTLFLSIELAVLDALWPAFRDAAAAGDRRWLRMAFDRTRGQLVAAAAVFATGLVIIGQEVVQVWSGGLVSPSLELLAIFAAIAVVQAVELPHGRILLALGSVRPLTVLALINAAINLPMSILLGQAMGVAGVAAGTLIGYSITVLPTVFIARRSLAQGRELTG